MKEKDMVNDVLSMVNNSITTYGNVIAQANNQQFRQTIQQLRNNCEMFQYNLYKVAEQKGYYKPASQADQSEIQQIKNEFAQ